MRPPPPSLLGRLFFPSPRPTISGRPMGEHSGSCAFPEEAWVRARLGAVKRAAIGQRLGSKRTSYCPLPLNCDCDCDCQRTPPSSHRTCPSVDTHTHTHAHNVQVASSPHAPQFFSSKRSFLASPPSIPSLISFESRLAVPIPRMLLYPAAMPTYTVRCLGRCISSPVFLEHPFRSIRPPIRSAWP